MRLRISNNQMRFRARGHACDSCLITTIDVGKASYMTMRHNGPILLRPRFFGSERKTLSGVHG